MAKTSKKATKSNSKTEERKKLFDLLQKSLNEYSDRLGKKKFDKFLQKTSKKIAGRLRRVKKATPKTSKTPKEAAPAS